MRRVMLCHVYGLSLMLTLTGCDTLVQRWPSLFDPEPPHEPDEPTQPGEPTQPTAPSIERASTFLPIEGSRALSATTQGFRVIDLRDPENPRVEGSFALASEKLELYRMGDHVILVATYPRGYEGERADVPVRRVGQAPASLFNIDIRDRARPRLINELQLDDLPRHSRMRRTPDGYALFLLPMIWNGAHYASRVERFELRQGVLTQTGQLALDGVAEAIAATPEQLLLATQRADNEDEVFTVTALDMSQPELRVAYSNSLAGRVGPTTQLMISGDQLRVSFIDAANASSVATLQLHAAPSAAPSGVCTIGDAARYQLEPQLFSASTRELFASDAAAPQLERLTFDASGRCPERSALGPESRAFALHELARERLLVLGADDVRLYDSASPAESALLARAAVSARCAAGAQQALQITTLQQPAAAGDGTDEPLLASVRSSSSDYSGRYELLTLSDATLTARGQLDVRGTPSSVALIGRSLVAVSSTGLRAFDAHSLDAPLALGQLELAEHYRDVFGFGEHVARVRQHPAVLPPGERSRAVRDDLQILHRDTVPELVASLPVESEGQWLQLGSLLVNAQVSIAQQGTESERKARVTIQVYDLNNPAAPRKAGALSTTAIEAEWTPGHFYEPSVSYLAVGDALVIPQRKREPDVHVRQCWRSVDYDTCSSSSAPGCEPETYEGTLLCRTIDAEPEVCTVHGLMRCDAARCDSLDELPAGIPSSEDGCNEYEELGRFTTFAFNVIDLSDPDQPSLIRPLLALPGRLLSHQYFASNSNIYVTELEGEALFASRIDFGDPRTPQLTPRLPVSGRVVTAIDEDMYIGPPNDGDAELTLTRVRCCDDAQPLATRSWPGRSFGSLQPDGAGHLLLLHAPAEGSETQPEVQANWTRLEILDAQTLATLGTLDIDRYASAVQSPTDGRLVVDSSGVLYIVDLRNAQLPRIQAAVPYSQGAVAIQRDQLIVADELGFQRYPLALDNMIR